MAFLTNALPGQPWMHITIWNDIATVRDSTNQDNTSELCSKEET